MVKTCYAGCGNPSHHWNPYSESSKLIDINRYSWIDDPASIPHTGFCNLAFAHGTYDACVEINQGLHKKNLPQREIWA
jgi:hypothetical protein